MEAGAHVGSLVVLADGVAVGEGTTVERAVVLNGAQIGPGCTLRDCIVAAGVRIGAGTQITGGAVLGEGVTIGAENIITRGARIFPGVTLPDGALQILRMAEPAMSHEPVLTTAARPHTEATDIPRRRS